MKRIAIDFAQFSLARVILQTRPLTWLLACVGGVLCISVAFFTLGLVKQQDMLETEIKSLKSALARKDNSRPSILRTSITVLQANSINGAIAQLNLPWQDLLDTMESATPSSVALLALDPDGSKQLLKVTAETQSVDDMLTYIEALKQQTLFTSVALIKHEVNEQDPYKPVRFQFETQWNVSAK